MSIFVYAAAAIVVLFFTIAAASASTQGGGDTPMLVSSPSAKVKFFAGAIAFAEGFWDKFQNVHASSRPARNNNPGDFLGNGDAGQDDGGYAVYSTLEKGWERLYGQLQMIIDGTSHNYVLSETISDMAYTYTSTQQDAWAENAASFLGVTRDTVLRGLLT